MISGGRLYGEGMHGKTFDFGCETADKETFCAFLKKRRPIRIKLYAQTGGKTLVLEKPDGIKAFLAYTNKKERCIAKVFKSHHIGFDKVAFKKELVAMELVARVYGSKLGTYTNTTPMNYNGFMFVGAYIVFENKSHMYATFTQKCETTVEETPLTIAKAKQLAKQILCSLEILQKSDVIHCDLKPKNMVYCKKEDAFKLIDWGLAKKHEFGKITMGSVLFTSPMSYYVSGIPKVFAPKVAYYATKKRSPEWFKSPIFKEIYAIIEKEFAEVVERKHSKKALFDRYVRKFDVHNLGLSLAYLAHKNGLDWERMKPLVVPLVSLKGPLNAKDASKKIVS